MSVDTVVIGGGIVGLAAAYEFIEKYPSRTVVVCERERYLGDHTTGRNSGVLHSGIYYKHNSLKHLLSRRGLKLWSKISTKLNFNIDNCGKYIVSNSYEELTELRNNGLQNGVKVGDIIENTKKLEDIVKTKYSIFLSETSLLDVPEVIKILERALLNKGVIILKNSYVSFNKNNLYINKDLIECDNIINCAGLWAVQTRKMLNLFDVEDYYVAGNYLSYNNEFYNESLVYPLPNIKMNTLGIHTCVATDGTVYFGPSAETVNEVSYVQSENIIQQLYPEIAMTFKNIDPRKLGLAYMGIRPKIKINNQVQSDFTISSHSFDNYNYIEALGIESPGLTCAFSIAEELVRRI